MGKGYRGSLKIRGASRYVLGGKRVEKKSKESRDHMKHSERVEDRMNMRG